MYKETLVKDLTKLARFETAIYSLARRMTGVGIAVVFLAIVWIAASVMTAGVDNQAFIIAAGVVGGYMAINIGANDVTNNVGPAVGAKSLTMMGALIIAGIFESAGAIIAGGDVVETISKNIIDASLISEPRIFMWSMLAALLAAALWINFATYVNAPVSTTHSIVGAVMGAGVTAAGLAVVDWKVMAAIAASWVVSPLLGGAIAALFLAFVKSRIIYQRDKLAGAKRWVPVLVALMAGVFSSYLVMKGLQNVWNAGPWTVTIIGVGVYVLTYVVVRPLILRRAKGMENRNQSIRTLFHLPLICAAALLSFAHGSNDVANAIGPLAAIVATATTHDVKATVGIPPWVMFVGAAGITMGLLLFGPRLIRVVGDQITRMNPMRAYCVALSAAITVIVASALGLPVSSTHIAVGAVFGVGFLREYYTTRRTHLVHGRVMKASKPPSDWERLPPMEKAKRRKLVRRRHLWTIVAAWLITVPLSAGFAAAIFLALATFLG